MTRLTDAERLLRSISERDFQKTVIDYARARGWKVYCTRQSGKDIVDAKGKRRRIPFVEADSAGWPDVFAVSPSTHEMVAVECKKRGPGKRYQPTPEQRQWLEWLSDCGVKCWTLAPGPDVNLEEIFG